MASTSLPAKAPTSPDFQTDAEELFKHFDKIQNERDKELVLRLKDGLDALLIYGGLFSAVNSAFLIYTLPDLKPNPADDTNALIYQLLLQTMSGNQSSDISSIYFPSDEFIPEPNDVITNQLFSISPTISLLGSFVATLGRYWLTGYLSKSGRGLDHERWVQLNRTIGAHPLVLFITGFILHLNLLQLDGNQVFGFFLLFVPTYLLGGLFYRLVDPFCPYRTPVEALLRGIWAVTRSVSVACYQLLKRALLSIWNWLEPQRNQESFTSSEGIGRQRTVTKSGDIIGHIQLQVEPIKAERSPSGALLYFWQKSVVQPKPREILHAWAIMDVFHASLDPIALYHAASSLCSISDLDSLRSIIENRVSRDRLKDLLGTARRAVDRSPKRGTTADEVQENEKRIVVFGTAILHLYFSSDPLITPEDEADLFHKDIYSELNSISVMLWHSQSDRFGHQPPAFTSASLAAGVLMGCLDPSVSIFHEELPSLSYRLESASSGGVNSWNQLALLALACNTRGGRAMSEDIDDGFRKIQTAYATQEPTDELADAVNQAIQSHAGERTQLPCVVFKLAWKLFVHGRQDGNAVRAFGQRIPFLQY
ncbi:hypothetical protein FS837_011020 [Tulasnella sp. UAMH 9824]|nr:hypothetical protein FS837_011020 [Tulasnella sp. UAMH 9824]